MIGCATERATRGKGRVETGYVSLVGVVNIPTRAGSARVVHRGGGCFVAVQCVRVFLVLPEYARLLRREVTRA